MDVYLCVVFFCFFGCAFLAWLPCRCPSKLPTRSQIVRKSHYDVITNLPVQSPASSATSRSATPRPSTPAARPPSRQLAASAWRGPAPRLGAGVVVAAVAVVVVCRNAGSARGVRAGLACAGRAVNTPAAETYCRPASSGMWRSSPLVVLHQWPAICATDGKRTAS